MINSPFHQAYSEESKLVDTASVIHSIFSGNYPLITTTAPDGAIISTTISPLNTESQAPWYITAVIPTGKITNNNGRNLTYASTGFNEARKTHWRIVSQYSKILSIASVRTDLSDFTKWNIQSPVWRVGYTIPPVVYGIAAPPVTVDSIF
jgi:hypothetical protein